MTARVASWVLLVACWGAVSAGPAVAGWSAATPIEKGVDPILVFGPSGDAAIGSSVMHDGGSTIGATFLARRAPHRKFGRPQRFGPVQDLSDAGSVALKAIALPSDGAAAALFGSYSLGPIKAFVQPRGARRFGAAQQIVKLGDVNGDTYQADTTTVVDTTRGEVVEAGQDSNSNLSTATLARGSTRFVVARSTPAGLTGTDIAMLATDAAGGTFLTGDGTRGCTTVAYRPPQGRFRTTYQTSDCTGNIPTNNYVQGIVATGDGYAALLTVETANESSRTGGPLKLFVQVGRFGRFSAPTLLSSDVPLQTGPNATGFIIATDRDGSVTVGWFGCSAGNRDCGVYGEQGSVYGGFAGQPALLAADTPHVRLTGLGTASAVAVQRCAAHRRCTIGVALADRSRRFGQLQPITADGRLPFTAVGRGADLQSDSRDDLLLIWTNHRGIVYAATRSTRAHRFGPPHRLSGPGVNANTVTSAYGPRGEAIVAWSLHSGKTMAAVYDQTPSRPRGPR
ncbi:MAG: hypothetical protein M3Y17_09320 [Actinomycetota bacterium]|nr:hypothetical protein [Actinomycetota bacterium]